MDGKITVNKGVDELVDRTVAEQQVEENSTGWEAADINCRGRGGDS